MHVCTDKLMSPAMKTCFVQNVIVRTQLERFASDVGLVVMQRVVKTEIMYS